MSIYCEAEFYNYQLVALSMAGWHEVAAMVAKGLYRVMVALTYGAMEPQYHLSYLVACLKL